MSEPLIVGRIGAPHGIRGWSQLTSLTDPVDNILEYEPLLLERHGAWQPLDDVEFSRKGNKLLIRFGGNTDRTVAEGLRGLRLGLAPEHLPVAPPDEFYWRDLIGLTAIDVTGRKLGTVDRLLDTTAHAVLVIVPLKGDALSDDEHQEDPTDEQDDTAEVLVPFVDEFTGAVDLAAGTIVIDWPEFDSPAASAGD